MKYIFRKYEFETEGLANKRINALSSEQGDEDYTYPTHSHSIVKLGRLNDTELYSVDVLWKASEITDENGEIDYPYGWVSKEVEPEGNGVHTFAGRNF